MSLLKDLYSPRFYNDLSDALKEVLPSFPETTISEADIFG